MLDEADWEIISQKIPDLSYLEEMVYSFSPDFDSIYFIPHAPNTYVPIASVCLNDALHTLSEARYALMEVFAHQIWYLDKKDHPNLPCAAYFGRFYAGDAALRLYSAAEHLSAGIIMMLEITDADLKYYMSKGKRRKSQQAVLGNYLRGNMLGHSITTAVDKLAQSQNWQKAMDYRNRLVHEQPPTVNGLGIVYKRRIRCEITSKGGFKLVGGGDKPEYSVDDLVQFIQPAMFQFTDTFTSVVEFYMELLKNARNNSRFLPSI